MSKLPDAEKLCTQLARELKARVTPASAMVGIHTGGAWVAERLHQALKLQTPLATLDVSFYRDDYQARGLHKDVQRSDIPFEVEGRDLVLVDDVLYTGRTIRAALHEIFDYGRPASVKLAVLVDRDGRQLPIAAQYAGTQITVGAGQSVGLKRDAGGRLSLEVRGEKR